MPRKVIFSLALAFVLLAGTARAEYAGPPLLQDNAVDERHESIRSMGDVPTSAVPHIHDRFDVDLEGLEMERVAPVIEVPQPLPENMVRASPYSIAPLPPLAPIRIGTMPNAIPGSMVDKTENNAAVSRSGASRDSSPVADGGKKIEKRKSKPQQVQALPAAKAGIMATVQSTPGLKKLAKLLRTVGLKPMFDAKGIYTLFAPSDAAFDRVSAKYLAELEKPENRDLLLRILGNHIIGGYQISEKQLAEMRKSPVTMAAQLLTITNVDITIQVNRANILAKPLLCSNGIIYVIDQVLLPTSPCSVGDHKECP